MAPGFGHGHSASRHNSNMKLLFWFAPVVLAIASSSGCAKPHKIVGSWKPSIAGAPDMEATLTFRANQTVEAVAPIPTPKGKQIMTSYGTYKLVGDTLTITMTDFSVSNSEMPELGKIQMLEQMNMDPTSKIEWDGNDKFYLLKGAIKVIHTRIK